MSKKSENIHAYRGGKVADKVQISAHWELRNKNEKSYRAQIRVGIKSPNAKKQLFQTKIGKTWHFIKNSRNKTKN